MKKHSLPRIIISLITLIIGFSFCQSDTLSAAPFVSPEPAKITYRPLNFAPTQPYRFTLSNGLTVYILENHELPVVKLNLIVKSGAQTQWSVFSLKKDFEKILGIFSELLQEPLFDEGRLKLGKDLKSRVLMHITPSM